MIRSRHSRFEQPDCLRLTRSKPDPFGVDIIDEAVLQQGMALDNNAHTLFVDAVSDNLYTALSVLERRARGDYPSAHGRTGTPRWFGVPGAFTCSRVGAPPCVPHEFLCGLRRSDTRA